MDHTSILKTLCRICGERFVEKRGYPNAKNVQEYGYAILIFYGFDVNNECQNQSLYPQSLCMKCNQKLVRLSKNSNPEHPGVYLESFKFLPHSQNCEICFKYGPKPESIIKVKIDDVDQCMKKIGFLKVPHPPVPYKRVFFKPTFSEEGKVINELTLRVDKTNQLDILVYGKHKIPQSSLPKLDELQHLVEFFNNHKVCRGISGFEDVIESRLDIKHVFLSTDSCLNAYIENKEHVQLANKDDMAFIRHKECILLIDKQNKAPVDPDEEYLCQNCKRFKTNQLIKIRSRILDPDEPAAKKRRSDDSNANVRYLLPSEVKERLKNAQAKKWELMKKVSRLNARVQEDILSNAVDLQPDEHDVIQKIIKSKSFDFEFDEDSPQWLLWQQQKIQASKKDSRGMRWHPLIIRWCLSIYKASPAAYRQMSDKNLNFLQLPCVSTLKKYINFTDTTVGFNPDILKKLAIEADIKNMSEKDKHVIIAFDEMKIKSGLVYHKGSGKLIGFTEMGDLNQEFAHLERSNNTTSDHQESFDLNRDIATHVNLYMVRGICSKLLYPFGYFATAGMTASELYLTTNEAIRVLTAMDFKVRALVSDGAATNRKMYRIMAKDFGENFHWGLNQHGTLPIYFFSDAPHLLKTTRNCFENSLANKNTRNLHLDGQDISWQHIVRVVEEDMGIFTNSEGLVSSKTDIAGLRKLKLTDEHIHLTPRSRMTVKLAAQVLSQTTANALEMQGRHDTKSTIAFVKTIDRAFDCLNVSRVNLDRKGKRELAKYEAINDWRFHFLEVEFLEDYLGRWEEQVEEKIFLTKEEKQKQLLSAQTRLGWKMSVLSFVRLTKELLSADIGIKFVLSEKFSQDPVEEHFGRQRRQGGLNENPTLLDFIRNEGALGTMKSELIQGIKGNAQAADRETVKIDINDTRRLPTKETKDQILKYD